MQELLYNPNYNRALDVYKRQPVKSIGHGITTVVDLSNEEEVWRVSLELTQGIGHRCV